MWQRNEKDDAIDSNSSKDLPVSSSSNKVMKMAADIHRLPEELLDIISKKLDFDDHFLFSGVCKNWRALSKSYRTEFMASQAPLALQTSSYAKKACDFISISEDKVYRTHLDNFWGFYFAGFSNGYVMVANNNTLLLMNPFTRKKKKINTSNLPGDLFMFCHAILAFAVGSEEFLIVALCKETSSLHIYRSRNSCWETYSRKGNPWQIMDVGILNHTVYGITDEAQIVLLNLNSAGVKFLPLNNTPSFTRPHFLKLVSTDDGQLLVVHFVPLKHMEVYKIDFSSMEWVKMETLGDLALFLGTSTRCYALSNPRSWGYDSNVLYYIDLFSPICKVYSMNNELVRSISPKGNRAPRRSRLYWAGWCFRHLREEVDYSLVE